MITRLLLPVHRSFLNVFNPEERKNLEAFRCAIFTVGDFSDFSHLSLCEKAEDFREAECSLFGQKMFNLRIFLVFLDRYFLKNGHKVRDNK